MRPCIRIIITLLFCFVYPASAVEVYYGGEVSEQFFVERNYFSSADPVGFNYDDTGNILAFSPFISATNDSSSVNGYLLGDIYWLHSFENNEGEIDADFANAFVSFSKNRLSVSAGLLPFSFGRGFVFDDNEPGVIVEVDLPSSVYFECQAAKVIHSSQMASITLGVTPGLFEKVEVFGSVFSDKDDAIAEVLNQYIDIVVDDEPETIRLGSSTGNLIWLGGGADLFVGDVFVSSTLIFQGGSIRLTSESSGESRKYSVPSLLFDVEAQYNLTQSTSAGAFLLVMTGEQPGQDKDLNVFIAPSPMNSRTSIFMNERFGIDDSGDSISSRGVNFAGVVSPGLKIDHSVTQRLSLQLISALLYPYDSPGGDRTFFGWETDTRVTFELTESQKLYLETDLFMHGNYFREDDGGSPPAAMRMVLGYNLWF